MIDAVKAIQAKFKKMKDDNAKGIFLATNGKKDLRSENMRVALDIESSAISDIEKLIMPVIQSLNNHMNNVDAKAREVVQENAKNVIEEARRKESLSGKMLFN